MTREDVWFAFWVMLFWAFLLLCVLPARAEEPHDHAALGSAGELYARWKMPNGGRERTQSCCNLNDCYATAIKNVAGVWFARKRETGQWIPIPDSKLEELQIDEVVSPDGQSHLCSPPHNNNVYCAMRGDGI